jgi:hypothetical protein
LHYWHDFILADSFFGGLRDDPGIQTILKQVKEEETALWAQVRRMEARRELGLKFCLNDRRY